MAKTPSKKAPAKAVKKPADEKKKKTKKRVESYSTYIYKFSSKSTLTPELARRACPS